MSLYYSLSHHRNGKSNKNCLVFGNLGGRFTAHLISSNLDIFPMFSCFLPNPNPKRKKKKKEAAHLSYFLFSCHKPLLEDVESKFRHADILIQDYFHSLVTNPDCITPGSMRHTYGNPRAIGYSFQELKSVHSYSFPFNLRGSTDQEEGMKLSSGPHHSLDI